MKNLQLAVHTKGNSLRDSGFAMVEDDAAVDKDALLPGARVPLERPGMPSIAEILQRTSN